MKTKNSPALAVGIDVHKKRHYARVKIRETREIISPILKIYNSKRGLDFLLEKVNHLMEKYQAKGVIFALEPTGIYWKPLGYALHDRGCLVHLVNPVQVHYKRKQEDPAANKNDKIDPGLICDLVCDGKSNPARFMLGIFRLLQKTVRNRRDLVLELSSKKIKLKTVIYELCPELVDAFTDITGKVSMAILRFFPSIELLESTPLEELSSIFRIYGSHKTKISPEKLLSQVQFSLGIRSDNQAHIKQIQMILERIDLLKRQISILKKDINGYLKELGQTFTSIKGIGPILAAEVIAEVGDINTFSSGGQLVKLAGLDTVESSSGETKRRRHISKKGISSLRTTAILAAFSLIKSCPPFRDYFLYQTKVLAKKPMQAVIAVADKFLRVCFYMSKNKTSFDPKRIGTGNLRTKAKFLNQSLEVSLDSKEIANLDLNLLKIFSKSPKVVLFDEEDPTWVKIRINSKVETFDLEEPRGRILALLNAL